LMGLLNNSLCVQMKLVSLKVVLPLLPVVIKPLTSRALFW
jgi:hypothetical protein